MFTFASAEGEEEAGKVDIAHDPGEEHALGAHLRPLQAGILPLQPPEDLRGLLQHRGAIQVADAVFVPGHLIGVFVGQVRKPGGDALELLHADLLMGQAAAGHEVVPVVEDPPEQAEAAVEHRPRGEQGGKDQIEPLSPLPPAEHPHEGYSYVNQPPEDRRGIDQLRQGEGQHIGHPAEQAVHRAHKVLRQGAIQGMVAPCGQVQADDQGVQQDQHMPDGAELPDGGEAAFLCRLVFHARIVHPPPPPAQEEHAGSRKGDRYDGCDGSGAVSQIRRIRRICHRPVSARRAGGASRERSPDRSLVSHKPSPEASGDASLRCGDPRPPSLASPSGGGVAASAAQP